jgi:tetratricopeptide (TPR) repeat protein
MELIQTTAPISHGSSGGGLFDSKGRLVGITAGGFEDSQNLNFAVPAKWVLALDSTLESLEPSKTLRGELSATPSKAKTTSGQTVSAASPADSVPTMFDTTLQAGSDAVAAKDYDKALSLFSLGLEMRPDDPSCLLMKGRIYVLRNQPLLALPLCKRVAQNYPLWAEGWACLGDIYSSQDNLVRDVTGAEAAYRRALELDPEPAVNWMALGLLLVQKGDRQGVMQVYEELKKRDIDAANLLLREASR